MSVERVVRRDDLDERTARKLILIVFTRLLFLRRDRTNRIAFNSWVPPPVPPPVPRFVQQEPIPTNVTRTQRDVKETYSHVVVYTHV